MTESKRNIHSTCKAFNERVDKAFNERVDKEIDAAIDRANFARIFDSSNWFRD